MKILYVYSSPSFNPMRISGQTTHILETINALRKIGHEVKYVNNNISNHYTLNNATGRYDYLKELIPRTIHRTIRDINIYATSHMLSKRLSAYAKSYDLIYERLLWLSEHTSKIAEKYKVPYFVEVNAPYEEMINLNLQSPLYRFALKIMLRQLNRATAIVVVSSGLKEYLINLGMKSDKIHIMPNGVNEQKFDTTKIDSSTIRKKLKIEADDVVIGYSGRLSLWGGLDKFRQIAKRLTEYGYHKKVKVLIVGSSDDEDWEKFLAEINKLKYPDIFRVTGFIDYSKIQYYIAVMDICFMPESNWYGSPIKLAEYGVMSKALLFPDTLAITDVIETGKEGLLFNQEDDDDLWKKLKYLIDNPKERKRMGEEIKKKIIAKHTWTENAEAIMDIYNNMR